MPFTAGHPAAVAALARCGLPVPALVIGSITPDLVMMLPIPVSEVVHFVHTPLGLVTADLAIGVAAFAVWQGFLGPALIALAPKALRRRLPETLTLPSSCGAACGAGGRAWLGRWHHPPSLLGWWRVVLAVLLGAATHLVWDSFTHDWMWGPEHIAWLAERHGPLLGWQWAQRLSDLVGLTVVAAWVAAWWRRAPVRPDTPAVMPLRYQVLGWLTILGPATVAFWLLLLLDSFYAAVTAAAGLGVIGLAVVASVAIVARPLKP